MKVSLVTVGDEVLAGEIVDTNAAEVSRALTLLGCEVVLRLSVGDREEEIVSSLDIAAKKADFIAVIGGLGPTRDDRTREAVARWLRRPLRRLPELEGKIRLFFEERGRSYPEEVLRQAEIPEGAEPLENTLGTAPGIRAERGGKVIFCLPGVPAEMRAMLERFVLPEVKERREGEAPPHVTFMFCEIGESTIAWRLSEIWTKYPLLTPAFYPRHWEVRLTVRASEATEEARSQLEAAASEVKSRLGEFIFGEGEVPLPKVVGELLRQKGKVLAVAESCTAGLLGKRITDIPGSSDYFWGGVICYANEAKVKVLGVSERTLRDFGAVSEQCAKEMARGVRRLSGADLAVAMTGIAGPTGGTAEKPVGLVHLALSSEEGEWHAVRIFPGDRKSVRMRATTTALDMVRRYLLNLPIRERSV